LGADCGLAAEPEAGFLEPASAIFELSRLLADAKFERADEYEDDVAGDDDRSSSPKVTGLLQTR